MTDCAAGTVDSQLVELHVKGGAFATSTLVADVLEIPLPAGERTLDDVTPVSALFAEKLAAGVIDYGNLDMTLLQRTNTDQQVKLQKEFIAGTCLEWEIKFPDTAKTSHKFHGTISKWAPSREKNKKNRINATIGVSGAVDQLENDVSVLNPP